MGRIAKKAFQFLGCKDSEFFEGMGYYFINFLGQFGYGDVLALLGRQLRDFLNGLDNLHEYLKFSYPRYELFVHTIQVNREEEYLHIQYMLSFICLFFQYFQPNMSYSGSHVFPPKPNSTFENKNRKKTMYRYSVINRKLKMLPG